MPKVGRTPDIEIVIGSKIREARVMRGLSQEKLSEALGLTFQQVQKYEKGTNRVAVSTLLVIANALQVKPLDLIPEYEGPEFTLPEIGTEHRQQATEIALRLSKLPPPVSRALMTLIKSMAKGEHANAGSE